MPVRLSSQRDPSHELILTDAAWQALLDLAEAYGWNPYAPVLPWQWDALELDLSGYAPGEPFFDAYGDVENRRRLVVLDDALNLADALERAFLDYEPQRVPASFYLFAPEQEDTLPGLGALTETLKICQKGPFWIEDYHRQP